MNEMYLELPGLVDFEQLEKSNENTKTIFICFVLRLFDFDDIYIETIDYLNKSIKILESKELFSKKQLIGSLLNADPDQWDDLFNLDLYNEEIKELQILLDDLKSSNDSEDLWVKDRLRINKAKITSLQEIIDLSTTFRRLMFEVIPDLETQFKQKFDEYNEQQANEAERKAETPPPIIKVPQLETNLKGGQISFPYDLIQTENTKEKFIKISKSFLAEIENCKEHPEAPKWEGKQINAYYHLLWKSKMFRRCKFTAIVNQLNIYYNLKPAKYKPAQLENEIARLKHEAEINKYPWINSIEQK